MQYFKVTQSMRKSLWLIVGVATASLCGQGAAAPQWTVPNTPSPSTVALYHFDEASSVSLEATVRTGVPAGTFVNHLLNDPALNQNFALEFYNFNAANVGEVDLSTDVASDPMAFSSLALDGVTHYRAKAANATVNSNHFTVEAWVKWDDSPTSADLVLGGSDRSLRIIRDTANPANDRIGFQASHGGWRPHPGFTGFASLPDPPVDGQWFHVAMVIHNAGMHEHSGHHHYEPGSFAMFFVNGHLVGAGTQNDRVDISEDDEELVFHGSDRIQIRTAGTTRVLLDEFTVWHEDPTNGGAVTTRLFSNGRGGTSSVANWMLFE